MCHLAGKQTRRLSGGTRKWLAKKKWDTKRTEESRQEYREMVKVQMEKQWVYDDLYAGWTARRERLIQVGEVCRCQFLRTRETCRVAATTEE